MFSHGFAPGSHDSEANSSFPLCSKPTSQRVKKRLSASLETEDIENKCTVSFNDGEPHPFSEINTRSTSTSPLYSKPTSQRVKKRPSAPLETEDIENKCTVSFNDGEPHPSSEISIRSSTFLARPTPVYHFKYLYFVFFSRAKKYEW